MWKMSVTDTTRHQAVKVQKNIMHTENLMQYHTSWFMSTESHMQYNTSWFRHTDNLVQYNTSWFVHTEALCSTILYDLSILKALCSTLPDVRVPERRLLAALSASISMEIIRPSSEKIQYNRRLAVLHHRRLKKALILCLFLWLFFIYIYYYHYYYYRYRHQYQHHYHHYSYYYYYCYCYYKHTKSFFWAKFMRTNCL